MKLQKKGDFVMKKIISLILICSIILAFLTGCSYFEKKDDDANEKSQNNESQSQEPEKKYTGGISSDRHFHLEYGVYWLETYEEVLEAVELLKSHGSTIERSIGFNCEGELLDVKWCFMYKWSKAEPLEDGKNFFDRRIDDGEFIWYGFFDDVSIDDFLYDRDVTYYDYLHVSYMGPGETQRTFESIENVDDLSLGWPGQEFGDPPSKQWWSLYYVMYKDKEYVIVHFDENLIPDEYHNDFAKSIVIIE